MSVVLDQLVLIVDDNEKNMRLARDVLRLAGFRTLEATTGGESITLAHEHLPDVILMDIRLPGISGIQALKILRADSATAHIPVVALSANAMPRDIEKGLAAGFFRYLTKPIKVNEFMDTLLAALEFAERIGYS